MFSWWSPSWKGYWNCTPKLQSGWHAARGLQLALEACDAVDDDLFLSAEKRIEEIDEVLLPVKLHAPGVVALRPEG